MGILAVELRFWFQNLKEKQTSEKQPIFKVKEDNFPCEPSL